MGFSVNTNVAALNAYRNLSLTQDSQAKSLEKLSSGLRINRAADDAAGLAISEGLRAQVNGFTVAARNAQDGISVVQTAEGALTEVHSTLQRMRDLAVQAANDTNNEDSRKAIDAEVKQLTEELQRITDSTNFNGTDLLKGGSLNFQVGANGDASSVISVALTNLTESLDGVAYTDDGAGNQVAGSTLIFTETDPDGVAGSGDEVSAHTNAQTAIDTIDAAITAVSSSRADLGAKQNRLESSVRNINVSIENLSASESRIRDTDMASEMMNLTRSQILSQAGTAMLAQANQANQGVLQLLG